MNVYIEILPTNSGSLSDVIKIRTAIKNYMATRDGINTNITQYTNLVQNENLETAARALHEIIGALIILRDSYENEFDDYCRAVGVRVTEV